MNQPSFRKAKPDDLDQVTDLLARLFQDHDPASLLEENREILQAANETIFLACSGNKAVGISHVAIRHDYVEGASRGDVCGYLEALYVLPAYRHRGIGRGLVRIVRFWSQRKGCTLFASDCELDNETSQGFHKKMGFLEVDRIIHYIKPLDQSQADSPSGYFRP